MRIKLIYPAGLDDRGRPRKLYKEMMPGLTMPYLAALIGPDHDVSLVNESVQDLDFEEPVDLVAITSITCRIDRAYQVAKEYRERGIQVIIGGNHATLFHEEASRHCDAVVIGESEGLWEEILNDASRKRLKPSYKLNEFPDLKGLPPPRWDLMDMSSFWFPINSVQAVRGCPYNCDFCTVTRFYGGGYRYRPVGDVLEDVRRAGAVIFFADDNILSHRDYCLELFDGLKHMGKFWYTQASFAEVADEEFLQRAKEAGCMALYIGIESINPKTRQTLGKRDRSLTTEQSREIIRMLRRHRIEILASMMVSPDDAEPETFSEMLDFLIKNQVAGLYFFILTPVPNSRLFERLDKEKRLLSRDWSKYDGIHCLYKPRHMSAEQLEDEFWKAQQRFYSVSSILRRYLYPPHLTLFLQNFIYRNVIKEKIHPMMGITRKTLPVRISLLFMPLMQTSWIRKLSRLLRLT